MWWSGRSQPSTIGPRCRCGRPIASLPDGIYEGFDHLDDDGRDGSPARIHVRLTVFGDRASFDFSATDDALEAPMNTTRFIAAASVYLRDEGRTRPRNPAERRLLSAARNRHSTGLAIGPRPGGSGGRRQSRDLSTRRRRRVPGTGTGRTRTSDGRRRYHFRSRHDGGTA